MINKYLYIVAADPGAGIGLVKKSRNAYHEKIHKCKKKNITEPVNQGSVVTFKFKLDQKVY